MKKIIRITDFKVGDKVKMVDEKLNGFNPRYYPMVGIVGVVVGIDKSSLDVQWPPFETEGDGQWFISQKSVVKVAVEK